MLNNILLKTLRDMKMSLFWWSLTLALFSVYMMGLYPSIEKNSEDLQSYIDSMPEGMLAVMGVSNSELDVTNLENYLGMEVFGFFYPFMLLAFAVTYGAGLVGGEEESGTLELLLSTPVPRWRVMLEKFAALAIFTLVTLLVTYLAFVVGGMIAGVDQMDEGRMLEGVFNMGPMPLFFATLALCIVGVKGGRGMALGVTLGIMAATYLLFTMGDLANIPTWIQRLSPWYYYDGLDVMQNGINLGRAGLLLALTAVLLGIGMWGFERRDIGV